MPWKTQNFYSPLYFKDGEGNGTPLQYSCLENPMDRGTWWAVVHGVKKSQTRLSNFTLTFHFHALEKEMAPHSSVLAWRIPGMAEPDGLPSVGVPQRRTQLKWLSSSGGSSSTWKTFCILSDNVGPEGNRMENIRASHLCGSLRKGPYILPHYKVKSPLWETKEPSTWAWGSKCRENGILVLFSKALQNVLWQHGAITRIGRVGEVTAR